MPTRRIAAGLMALLIASIVLNGAPGDAGLATAQGGHAPMRAGPALVEQGLIARLERDTGYRVRISYHHETGRVRFIGTDPDHPIPRRDGSATAYAPATGPTSPEEAAREFLSTYGRLFGLDDQARDLRLLRSKSADRGRSFVRFQQVHQGVPVFGGELIVQMGSTGQVLSANGEILPDPRVEPLPAIAAEEARERASRMVARHYGLPVDDLVPSDPELWVYNPVLLGAPGPRLTRLVWRVEVATRALAPVRELVLVDAHLGAIALHFNQIDPATYRVIYDNNNEGGAGLPGVGPVRIEGQGESLVPDVNDAYDFAGDTYDYYLSRHGRDSIDGAGMTIIATVRYCDPKYPCPYANAFWNGSQIVFGQGFASADDVVAHELTHGVTQHESGLFYYMQSGAVNEAFSDIWGEFVDLTNGAGNDLPAVRWLIGEDLPIGVIRSMEDPPLYGLPDKMSGVEYYCGTQDQGGVHTNCGVGLKAAYLMTNGDTFNGQTVTGLGYENVAVIFYEAQTNLLTSGADYADLGDCLIQACTNLVGTSGITAADCQQVEHAVDAVEMDQQPASCPATEAPICDSGTPAYLFFDDMEGISSGNWISAAIQGTYNTWYYPQNSHGFPNWDATYSTSGEYNIWGYAQRYLGDCYIAMTNDVAVTAGAYLHFAHAYSFEEDTLGLGVTYDGGVMEYSTNGGSVWLDAGSLFTEGGYNGTIATGHGNPLAGRNAFVGESNGYVSSRLSLASLAGDSVRFRFRMGTDPNVAAYGWFIDDVRIYTCGGAAPSPTPSLVNTPTTTPTSSPMPTATAATRTPTTVPTLPPPPPPLFLPLLID